MNKKNNNFYKPVVKWFINGPFNNVKTVKQIESFERMGFGGVLPIPITNHPMLIDSFGKDNITEHYLSEKYFEHYSVIVDECRKRDMKIWVWDDVFCPSGWAGGELIRKYPHLAGISLKQYKKGEKKLSLDSKIFHQDKEYFYEIISSGNIRTDVLSSKATKKFIEINYDAYKKYFQKDFGKTIVGFFTDEPGAGGCINGLFKCKVGYVESAIPWSRDFDKRFGIKYGYDIRRYLKCFFSYNTESEEAKKIRFDFANFVQDSFVENYMFPLKKWCNKYGIFYMGHLNNDERLDASLISNGNLLEQLRFFDIPGVDAVGRQITPGKEILKVKLSDWDMIPYNSNYVKFASSAANLNNKKFSLSEIGDCYGFGMTIDDFKWLADYNFVRGVNLFTLGHINYSNKGFAVQCTVSHYGKGNPLWQFYKRLNNYLYKVSKLLSSGTPDIKNAVWNPITTIFREKVEGINDYFEALCVYLQINGADFDIIGPEEIKNENLQYEFIFIPAGTTLNGEEKRLIEILANKIKVVVPSSLNLKGVIAYKPYMINYKSYNGLFVDYSCRVYSSLESLCYRDIEFKRFKYLRFIKKRLSKNKILYFIFNESDRDNFQGRINFNEKGYKLLLLDVERNKLYLKENNFFSIKVRQTIAVMFVKAVPTGVTKEKKEKKNLVKFKSKWKMVKGEKVIWDGKDFKFIKSGKLQIINSIRKNSFSGCIEYENYFESKKDKNLWIIFKEIKYACQVKVNNSIIGEVLWSPYEIEIDKRYIKKGKNKVSILIFNTLADYIRSRDFDALLERYCNGVKNSYFKMMVFYDKKKTGIGFKLFFDR